MRTHFLATLAMHTPRDHSPDLLAIVLPFLRNALSSSLSSRQRTQSGRSSVGCSSTATTRHPTPLMKRFSCICASSSPFRPADGLRA
ncbi:hypothetical protein BD309DRAFT_962166 [Dichomitus squalens]|uniref:Uncharacterized protein n=1 Tax=Dichomitus squalens TaxID=114155 RepID=A0A4Q9PQU8_9APHY|nr:hypothetical protein BD309DRAFT_962166 [Dichomitus squalens]TBU56644.1 hypothetical protein BD310DRAFT_931099 [Dichomitus squalens]